MSRKVLGLDIRSSSATAVLMETGFKTCAVTGFGHAPFPKNGTWHERLAETLSAISSEMDLKDTVCAMTVPPNRFFYRNTSVPFGEAKKIQQMLPYELESLIAIPVEDLLIDFNKIPPANGNDQTRILAAGIETVKLKSLLDVVESCGINPDVVFPGGYSTAVKITRKAPSGTNRLYLDSDGEICSLYLTISGEVSLIRSFSLPPAQVKSAIFLWNQIQQSIAGFETLFEMKVLPDSITINGFQDEKFSKQLETVSGITVEHAQIDLPPHCQYPQGDPEAFSPRASFLNALSCALFLLEGFKGMNFRKGPLAAKTRISEYRDRMIRTASIFGVVVFLWLAFGLGDIYMTQKKVNRLDSQIMAIYKIHFPDSRVTDYPVHQMKSQIETLKNAAMGSSDTGSQIRSIDLLKAISQAIPNDMDVRFSKFTLSEDGIYIDGTTSSFDLVNDIKSKLETIDEFLSVTPVNPTREGDSIRFKMRIETGREENP